MSRTIRIQEKISIWQILDFTFPDDVDISDIEHIKKAIKENLYTDLSTVEIFPETEEHIQYDYNTIQYL